MQKRRTTSFSQINCFVLGVALCCGFLSPALAQKKRPVVAEPALEEITDSDDDDEQLSFEQKLIQSNISIAEWFDNAADDIDMFLVGRRLTDKKNETSFKIENSSEFVDGKSPNNSTGVGVNLRLPNLEEYFQLKFTTYDEQKERRASPTPYRRGARQNNYGATVGLFRKLGDVRSKFEPRIELQNPLKSSQSLTFDSTAEMKGYTINPKLEFYADSTKGVGMFQALNFGFPLNKRFSLSWINEGDYQDRIHLQKMNNGLALGEVISEKSAMTYGFMLTSLNQPVYHLASYSFYTTWNYLVYRKILAFDLTPHWDFDEEVGFRGIPGLVFNITVNF